MTKLQHRDAVKLLGQRFAAQIMFDDDLIDQNVDYGIMRIWKAAVVAREDSMRLVVTLNDGDALPSNFVLYANSGSYLDAGQVERPFAYVPIESIGVQLTSNSSLATTRKPRLFFCDQQIFTIPTGLTGIRFPYYGTPRLLAGETIPDATEDGFGTILNPIPLPAWTQAAIHRAGYERTRQQYLDLEKSYKATEQLIEENDVANKQLFAGLQRLNTQNLVQR